MSIVISGGTTRRVTSSAYVQVREAVTELKRELEDLGWVNLGDEGAATAGLEDDPAKRAERLKTIRITRRRNPLAKNAANMLQHYVLGQGVSLRPNNKTLIAKIVDEFWTDSTNRVTFTGHAAMKEFLDTVFTDGEFFLVLYPDREAGTLELGHIDTLNVDDIILDPTNRKVARWYKVKSVERRYNFQTHTYEDVRDRNDFVYYRDWRNDPEKATGDSDDPPKALQRDGLVYHVAINKRGKRGESELAAAIDWIRAHKSFMEDRATLNRAAASIAWKKKRKGPASDIAAEVARLQSTIVAGGRALETNPPPATGSTVVENEASTLEWVKTDTGGPAALSDERILRMMTGAGMGGIPNHYQGDEASANLATATAMELPLLKTYEDWQTLLASVVRDVIEFLLSVAEEAGRIGPRDDSRRYAERVTTPQEVIAADAQVTEAEPIQGTLTMVPRPPTAKPFTTTEEKPDLTKPVDWYVDVDFPPIVQKELDKWVTAMKEFYAILPGANVESQKLVVEMFLMALGANDVDQIMERLFPPDMAAVPAQQVQDDQAKKIAAQVAGLLGRASSNGAAPPAGPEDEAEGVRESDLTPLAQYRVRRLLKAASEAVVGGDGATVGG